MPLAEEECLIDRGGLDQSVPDELVGVQQPDIEKHQESYVFYQDGQGEVLEEWEVDRSAISVTGMQPRDGTLCGDLIKASLRITQAPAGFSTPTLQKKVFKPPFKVRLAVTYRTNAHVAKSVRIEAHPLQDAQVSHMPDWRPNSNAAQSELGDAMLSRVMTLAPDQSSTHLDFEFPDLKFKKSSRMAKRWVAFTCRLNGDLLLVLYKLPSIILSRRNDQYWKANDLLAACNPGIKRPRGAMDDSGGLDGEAQAANAQAEPDQITPDYVEQWVTAQYEERGFHRGLDSSDMDWLTVKAGVKPGVLEVPKQSFDEFKVWFKKTLKTLKHTQGVWDASQPRQIAGFAMTREKAEDILKHQLPGTFLLRFSSEPGCFSISIRSSTGPSVEHFLLDVVDMQTGSLTQWVTINHRATHLLDVNTMVSYEKQDVFIPQQPLPKRRRLNSPSHDMPLKRANLQPSLPDLKAKVSDASMSLLNAAAEFAKTQEAPGPLAVRDADMGARMGSGGLQGAVPQMPNLRVRTERVPSEEDEARVAQQMMVHREAHLNYESGLPSKAFDKGMAGMGSGGVGGQYRVSQEAINWQLQELRNKICQLDSASGHPRYGELLQQYEQQLEELQEQQRLLRRQKQREVQLPILDPHDLRHPELGRMHGIMQAGATWDDTPMLGQGGRPPSAMRGHEQVVRYPDGMGGSQAAGGQTLRSDLADQYRRFVGRGLEPQEVEYLQGRQIPAPQGLPPIEGQQALSSRYGQLGMRGPEDEVMGISQLAMGARPRMGGPRAMMGDIDMQGASIIKPGQEGFGRQGHEQPVIPRRPISSMAQPAAMMYGAGQLGNEGPEWRGRQEVARQEVGHRPQMMDGDQVMGGMSWGRGQDTQAPRLVASSSLAYGNLTQQQQQPQQQQLQQAQQQQQQSSQQLQQSAGGISATGAATGGAGAQPGIVSQVGRLQQIGEVGKHIFGDDVNQSYPLLGMGRKSSTIPRLSSHRPSDSMASLLPRNSETNTLDSLCRALEDGEGLFYPFASELVGAGVDDHASLLRSGDHQQMKDVQQGKGEIKSEVTSHGRESMSGQAGDGRYASESCRSMTTVVGQDHAQASLGQLEV